MSLRIHDVGLWKETAAQRRLRHRVTAIGLIGLVVLVCIALYSLKRSHALWPVTTGQVLETRISVATVAAREYSSAVLYEVDARVVYEAAGNRYERWMRVSQIKRDRRLLESYVAKSGKTCSVQFNPANPEDATATLN